jgi:hypothetical protein
LSLTRTCVQLTELGSWMHTATQSASAYFAKTGQ